MGKTIRILMCGSNCRTVKGGMVTVVNNYLSYDAWKNCRIRYIPTHTEGSRAGKSLYFLGAYLRIFFLLLCRRADLVHLHMAERGSFYRKAHLVRLCRRLGVPVIIHHHGAEFEEFYRKMNRKQRLYVKYILELADRNLVLSSYLKKLLLKKAPNARVEILHNAVKVREKNEYRADRNRILMLGRLGKRKGTYLLLGALNQIRNQLPEGTEVWLCGDGEVEKVKKAVVQMRLGKIVTHVGWISGQEKEECLRHTAVHVLPSYHEALPMSILETMSMGIPNISTNIASIPEVIRDEVNGFLIEPGDRAQLERRLVRIMGDIGLRQKLSESSYQTVKEEFSLKECACRVEKIYERVCRDYVR